MLAGRPSCGSQVAQRLLQPPELGFSLQQAHRHALIELPRPAGAKCVADQGLTNPVW
jgi:hypothetical protein